MSSRFHVYCCARPSDIDRLKTDLACSPEIDNGNVGLSILWDQPSASGAYSRAIETATAEILVFAHCDVYFPKGWFERLAWEVERLAHIDRDWAVAGISSITPSGQLVGRIFDTSLAPFFAETSGVYGEPLPTPVPIVSADELALVVRRESGISFDPLLPAFHLYGTDIILNAEQQGRLSYGLDMPLIHNAKAQLQVGEDYIESYRYMIKKWRDRLPVPTTCGPLTSRPFAISLRRLRIRYKAIFRQTTYATDRISDPSAKARDLGLDQLLLEGMVDG
jgi:hypothetical protein